MNVGGAVCPASVNFEAPFFRIDASVVSSAPIISTLDDGLFMREICTRILSVAAAAAMVVYVCLFNEEFKCGVNSDLELTTQRERFKSV